MELFSVPLCLCGSIPVFCESADCGFKLFGDEFPAGAVVGDVGKGLGVADAEGDFLAARPFGAGREGVESAG